jgi:hypothetical protein
MAQGKGYSGPLLELCMSVVRVPAEFGIHFANAAAVEQLIAALRVIRDGFAAEGKAGDDNG